MLTPREYLRTFDRSSVDRSRKSFPLRELDVPVGSTVGVVLLAAGGPETRAEVPAFLYRQYMDPAVLPVRFGTWARDIVSRFAARRRTRRVRREFEAVGGRAPVLRGALDQAVMLQKHLDRVGNRHGLNFRVRLAMRYGAPSPQQTIRSLQADGIENVVLVPLYPQYSAATAGSALAYWLAAERREQAPIRSVATSDYPDDPDFVQAVSERMDATLQRFPKSARDSVRFVFVAHGSAVGSRKNRCDTFCCHVHRSVDAIMGRRGFDAPFDVAFQSQPGFHGRLEPRLSDVISRIGSEGHHSVLVVPVSYVTEQLDTAYRLDVTMRRTAERCGIVHYEVAAPVDCHPLFIRTLESVVTGRIRMNGTPLSTRDGNVADMSCPRREWTSGEGDGVPYAVRCRRCDFARELASRNGAVRADARPPTGSG